MKRTKDKSESFFLGIGINRYKKFSKLNNAVKDVKDVATILHDQFGFKPEPSFTSFLLDDFATRENIVNKLDEFSRNLKPNDRLLIYYAGHGYFDKITNRSYWLPVDSKETSVASFIASTTIIDFIKSMKCKHVLLISDSCFSSTLLVRNINYKDTEDAFEEWEALSSRWFFCSGKGVVSDGELNSNSPFAESILNYLKTSNAYKINIVQLADIVTKDIRDKYEQQAEISPLFGANHNGGQFVFCRNKDKQKNKKIEPASHIIRNPNIFQDTRDGQEYKKIKLKDGRVWMAQNLNFNTREGCCFYNNNENNENKYGRLYSWDAAQGACPPGWHLPDNEEWWNMSIPYGKADFYKKEKISWNFWNSEKEKKGELAFKALMRGGISGFEGEFGGWCNDADIKEKGSFSSLENSGAYWSRSERGRYQAYFWGFAFSDNVFSAYYNYKECGISCRCIQHKH